MAPPDGVDVASGSLAFRDGFMVKLNGYRISLEIAYKVTVGAAGDAGMSCFKNLKERVASKNRPRTRTDLRDIVRVSSFCLLPSPIQTVVLANFRD